MKRRFMVTALLIGGALVGAAGGLRAQGDEPGEPGACAHKKCSYSSGDCYAIFSNKECSETFLHPGCFDTPCVY